MHFARAEAAAVTLLDGRVLVAGGHNGAHAIADCEIYDPNTNTWTITGSMNEPRYRFPMVRLQDGSIFVAGGISGEVTDGVVATTAGCEIYDPKTGVWRSVAPMSEGRENFPAIVMPDGEVFLNGGLDANVPVYLALSEFYNPVTNTMRDVTPMLVPYFAQVIFYDSIHNQIFVEGGSNGGLGGKYWNTTQIYSVATDSWSYGQPSLASHDWYTNTTISGNTLLCLGGRTTPYQAHDTIEALIPPYTSWKFLGHLTSPRWHSCVVLVNDDSVLVIGGNDDPGVNSNAFDSTNWFVYNTGQTIQGPRMLQARSVFVTALTKVATGCSDSTVVLAFGGLSRDGHVINSCEKLVLGNAGQATQAQRLHRESASSFYGQTDTLPLGVDISSNINLDSVWPYLTDIAATYTWDSSIVGFEGYMAPTGWITNSLSNHGNSVDIDIQDQSGTASNPLSLGTALFWPKTKQLATTWVRLPVLTLHIGNQYLPLCTTDNEDSHWAVKTLGVQSGVAFDPSTSTEFAIYPNPVGGELFFHNPDGKVGTATVYDIIGRAVARAGTLLDGLDVHSLAPGVYFVRIASGGSTWESAVLKR